MNEEKNATLLLAFKRAVEKISAPHLIKIIEQGCDEGVFTTFDVQAAANMVMYISDFFDPALKVAIDARRTVRADDAAAKLRVAMTMQFLIVDRTLGLPDGTTNFGWPGVVELTMAIKPIHGPKHNDA